jgi:uncharacterized membrane protein
MFEPLRAPTSVVKPLGRAALSFVGYLLVAAVGPIIVGLLIGLPAYGCFWLLIKIIGLAAGTHWVHEHIQKLDALVLVGGLSTLSFLWFFGLIAAVAGAVQTFQTACGEEPNEMANHYLVWWIKQKSEPPEDGPTGDP